MISEKLSRLFKDKNNRSLSSNMIYTLLIKGGAMVISLLIVPAYVRYFGNDAAYGAWRTVASVFTWITMFDFGIGNGLRNRLVKTIAEKDDEASRKYISSAYGAVGLISLAFWAIGAAVIALVDWNSFLKVSQTAISSRVFKIYIETVFAGVVIHFFFLLINSISYAIQKTFLPSLITLITQIILLIYILIPNNAGLETKVLSLSWVYLLAYNIPILTVTLLIFSKQLKGVRPKLSCFDRGFAKDIMTLGGRFFLIQISLIVLTSSNEIFINLFYNPESVVQYDYYHKLFYVIMVFLTLIQQPIWSAVTKAYYERRYHWIKKVWHLMWGIAGCGILGSVVLALIYQPIANLWLGKGVLTVNAATLLIFVLFNAEQAIINVSTCFANGFGLLKEQTIFTVIGAVIKLPIAFLVASLSENWAVMVLATVLAMVPLLIVEPIVIGKFINKLDAQSPLSVGTAEK